MPQPISDRRSRIARGLRRLLMCALLTVAVVACNLTTAPATPTPPRFPTEQPLLIASITPLPGAVFTPPAPDGSGIIAPDPNCPIPVNWVAYTVETGDSMGLLAQQTSSSVQEIANGNCIADPDSLYVGQVLYLPRAPVVGP